MFFDEKLDIKLTLEIEGNSFSIPGGDVSGFSVSLYNYGFQAEVSFGVSKESNIDDSFINLFSSNKLIEVDFFVQRVYNLSPPVSEPLLLKGLVKEKTFWETTYKDTKGRPVLFRSYSIHFADIAQVLWKQHFPTELYTDTTMSKVIKAQIVKGITLKEDWKVLNAKHPIICLGLGDKENKASFYDFLMWYVSNNNGVWNYNSNTNAYTLSDKKNTAGDVYDLEKEEVEYFQVNLPAVSRADVHVMNVSAEIPKSTTIERTTSVSGIYQSKILRTSISAVFDDQKHIESSRIKYRLPEIEVSFKQFPSISFYPEIFVKFSEGGTWGSDLYPMEKDYRLYGVCIEAHSKKESHSNVFDTHAKYKVEMSGYLEAKEDEQLLLPSYEAPHYPILFEGKVVCQTGEEKDKTYMVTNDEETSLNYYKVNVPSCGNEVIVPFEPIFLTGHFYFPAFKDSRVILGVYLGHAEIKGFMDWGPGTRLPIDSEGNHILFGKNATSETSVKHIYKDNKPVLTIKRTEKTDTEVLTLQDGSIILQTKEEDS